jgi:peptidoglycan/LPS O-acetylase OafA/YrhL
MGVLRTILAISVIFAHRDWHHSTVFVGGRNAVQLFYVISGFLIHHVLNENPAYRNTLTFYRNRALRLYPLYWFVALLSLFLYSITDDSFYWNFEGLPLSAIAFFCVVNLVLFGTDWTMFNGVRDGHLVFAPLPSDDVTRLGLIVPQSWTLGVELSFYVIAPFVLRRPRWMIGLLVGSVLVRGVLVWAGVAFIDPWTYRFFPAELALFLTGALLNRYGLPFWRTKVVRYPWLPRWATLILVLLCLSWFVLPGPSVLRTALLFGLFLTLLPLTFVFQGGARWDQRIGDLSYPIYIGHWLVCEIVDKLIPGLSTFDVAWVSCFAAIAFAVALNRLIGVRVESRRAAVRTGAPVAALAR